MMIIFNQLRNEVTNESFVIQAEQLYKKTTDRQVWRHRGKPQYGSSVDK